jgi:hypothetical protein
MRTVKPSWRKIVGMTDHTPGFRTRESPLADPGDELVLEAAINSRAEALVTYNERDFAKAAPRFGLVLARPSVVLKRIGR